MKSNAELLKIIDEQECLIKKAENEVRKIEDLVNDFIIVAIVCMAVKAMIINPYRINQEYRNQTTTEYELYGKQR